MASQKKAAKPRSELIVPSNLPADEDGISPARQAMLDAVVETLIQLKAERDKQKAVPKQLADEQQAASKRQLTDEQQPIQENDDAQRSPSDAMVAKAHELAAEIIANAYEDTDNLGQFIQEWADHLEAIGCPPADVLKYFQLGERTLASLYLLAAQPGNPSPTEMRRLALRYGLDSRKPIDGDVNQLIFEQELGYWRIETEEPLLRRRLPVGLVKDSVAVQVLECVLSEPPQLPRLMRIIEWQLKRVPGKSDALLPPGPSTFSYEINGKLDDDSIQVRLWIGAIEVQLVTWKNVHQLLHELCLHPETRFKISYLKGRLNITNPSQAAKKIQQALGAIHPGASDWLSRRPIGWSEGHAPRKRDVKGMRK